MDDQINNLDFNQGVDFAIKHNLSLLDNFAFQGVFTSPGGIKHLGNLINAVRINAGDDPLLALEIITPQVPEQNPFDKTTFLTVKAINERGDFYNVNVLKTDQRRCRERVLYHWSQTFASQINEGKDYRRLQRTISIVLQTSPVHNTYASPLADVARIQWDSLPRDPFSDFLKLYL